MLGLLKDFGITALIIILNHFVYGVEDTVSYKFVVDFMATNKTFLLTSGILGSGALLIFTSLEGLGLYKVTYVISKVFIRLCQFFITFLSILNIVFYSAMSINLMRDGGYVTLFAFMLTLGSCCWALHIIDFNYSTKNTMLPIGVLAAMSVVLVEYIWPMTGF
jgi:hypothetical protein